MDSMVRVGLDSEVASGLGVEPVRVGTVGKKFVKKRSLMFSYKPQEGEILGKEVEDEALAILKQKERQGVTDGDKEAELQAEKDEIVEKSK